MFHVLYNLPLLELEDHLLVCVGIETSLVLLTIKLVLFPLFDSIKLLVLLKLIQGLSLLLNHITMSEGEIIESFDLFHLIFVIFPFILLVLQDLISLDKCVDLVSLVIVFILALLVHRITLEFK